MKIKICRNCQSRKLIKIFSLGKIHFTGKFLKKNQKTKKGNIEAVLCNACKLVQLNNNFDLKYMYGPDYGYRTGINKTMTNHVKKIVKNLTKKVNLKKGDYVLDIASNDGTLLNFYNKKIITFGIDPLINKFINEYKKINFYVSDFFSKKKIIMKIKNNKFKIISALSVFYDLKKPNSFLHDVEKILDDQGVFLLEFADLASIIKFNMFDTFCHEHLEYYSSKIIYSMCKKNNLRIFDAKLNNINGGSVQYFICKQNAKYKENTISLKKIFVRESKLRLSEIITYKRFINRVDKIKSQLLKFINNVKKQNKKIHVYGASTKGNVLLQYFGINNKHIDFAVERNPKKYNLYTPGTKIKIISEKKSRKIAPDYYLVLPWHFKNEILKRERFTIKKGSKFIFPLPKLSINS